MPTVMGVEIALKRARFTRRRPTLTLDLAGVTLKDVACLAGRSLHIEHADVAGIFVTPEPGGPPREGLPEGQSYARPAHIPRLREATNQRPDTVIVFHRPVQVTIRWPYAPACGVSGPFGTYRPRTTVAADAIAVAVENQTAARDIVAASTFARPGSAVSALATELGTVSGPAAEAVRAQVRSTLKRRLAAVGLLAAAQAVLVLLRLHLQGVGTRNLVAGAAGGVAGIWVGWPVWRSVVRSPKEVMGRRVGLTLGAGAVVCLTGGLAGASIGIPPPVFIGAAIGFALATAAPIVDAYRKLRPQ